MIGGRWDLRNSKKNKGTFYFENLNINRDVLNLSVPHPGWIVQAVIFVNLGIFTNSGIYELSVISPILWEHWLLKRISRDFQLSGLFMLSCRFNAGVLGRNFIYIFPLE